MGGVFGGDSSVKWDLVIDNPSEVTSDPIPETGKPRKHRQRGRENTDPGKYFVISIEVPRTDIDRNDLRLGLDAAAKSLAAMQLGTGRVWFRLRIEDTQSGSANEDQVKIDWPSAGSTGGPATSGGSIAAGELISGTTFGAT